MVKLKEQFLVDKDGNRIGVLIGMDDYRQLLEQLEELDAIRAYDAAKSANDDAVPFDEAVEEIERER